MTNQSIKAAFGRMWQYISMLLDSKSSVEIITWEDED
jgi:hypothetical protein